MNQYLTKKEFEETGEFFKNISVDDLISNSSYNETELLEEFNRYDDDMKIKLAKCAVHIAIIGAGGRSFGKIRHEGEVFEIEEILSEAEIKYSAEINSKYNPNDLTARRLVRLFRYLIQIYIEEKQTPSYLWSKYSTREKKFLSTCFPGAEHLIEKKEEADYLVQTYEKLDEAKGTKFVERVKTVFLARGKNF